METKIKLFATLIVFVIGSIAINVSVPYLYSNYGNFYVGMGTLSSVSLFGFVLYAIWYKEKKTASKK